MWFPTQNKKIIKNQEKNRKTVPHIFEKIRTFSKTVAHFFKK